MKDISTLRYFIIKSSSNINNPPVYIGATVQPLSRRLSTFRDLVKNNPAKYNIDRKKYFIQLLEYPPNILTNYDDIQTYIYLLMRKYKTEHANITVHTLTCKISFID